MIFCIIVDHGFGQNLVFLVTFGGFQVCIHKSGYLIHI